MKQHCMNWRRFYVVALITSSFLTALSAHGTEKFPTKPITIVVPWSAGGRGDLVARTVAPVYEKNLGQPVLVVNKPGASGYIGHKSVSSSKPDGYTLGLAGVSFLLGQYLGQNKVYRDECKWIGQVYSAAFTVSVSADSPFKTIDEFLQYARKNPMKLKHAHSGHGSVYHIFSEGFAKAADIKFTQIAYKGDGQMVVALASNEVDFVCSSIGVVRPLVEAGKIRILALQANRRSPLYPNVLTLKEKGVDWTAGSFEGIFGPKDMPEDVVNVLDTALEHTMKDSSLVEPFKKMDFAIDYKNYKEFTRFMEEQDKRLLGIVKHLDLIK